MKKKTNKDSKSSLAKNKISDINSNKVIQAKEKEIEIIKDSKTEVSNKSSLETKTKTLVIDKPNTNSSVQDKLSASEVKDNIKTKAIQEKTEVVDSNKNDKTVKEATVKQVEKTNKTVEKTKNVVKPAAKKEAKKKVAAKTKKATSVKKEAEVKKDKTVEVATAVVKEKPKAKAKTSTRATKKVNKEELTDFNTYLFHEGKNYEAYEILGSHVKTENRKKGVRFTTWAPKAKEVYLVGEFNDFEVKEEYKLEKITEQGLWSAFFAGIKENQLYKYCIVDQNGQQGEFKADPYAVKTEVRPNNASIVYAPKKYKWQDKDWMAKQKKANVYETPMNIYEIHLGSWKTKEDGTFLTYEEIAKELPQYIKDMGYTHVEIMPIVEHPLDASWGYQGTGYYSPTSRYGDLEGVKTLVDSLHKEDIGVILDWTPGHFCKDSHGLYHFDGTPTYEYQEEWRAENAGWGTCNFDLGRPEVKSFLISNALYWLREFHIDGLRVDAVSSMLYLDYDKGPGQWVPNKYGDNGNLQAIEFFKELNSVVFKEYPNALMIAEESTAWPNVTKPADKDGLGFNFKWNMGWMNDTLEYVKIDPLYRRNFHKNITFSMMYNYSENFMLPLSHDEVVHGKCSLINKMWGDEWNKYAGFRLFISYMMAHPGKKLTFMGTEFAQDIEWREYEQLQWNCLEEDEYHKQTQQFIKDINKLYLDNKAFWELDYDFNGFNWIEANNNEQSILLFMRKTKRDDETLIFINNFKPEVYENYRIGVPFLGEYEQLFNTDDVKYGGSGQVMEGVIEAENKPFHNQKYSVEVKVPPMATLVLKVKNIVEDKEQNMEIEDNKSEENTELLKKKK